MKGLKITLIGILSVFVLFLAAGLCFLLGGGVSSDWQVSERWGSVYTLQNTRQIDMTGVSELKMNFEGTGYDITLLPSESSQIVLEEYFSYEAEEEKFARIIKEEDSLRINGVRVNNNFSLLSFDNGGLHFGLNRSGYVKLYVPTQLFAQLETAQIISSSGNILFEFSKEALAGTMNLKELRLNTSSGNITAPFLRAEAGEINASSGNVKLGDCEGNFLVNTSSGDIKTESHKGDLELDSSSGNQTIRRCKGNLKASATSGNIKVGELAGKVDAQTSSGNITVEVSELSGDISLTGSSGNAMLTIPQDSVFSFEARTSSGDIRTFFDEELSFNKKGNQAKGTVGNSPAYFIHCSFTSGNVTVR